MNKKILLLGFLLVLTLGLVEVVTSYTSTEVHNAAKLNIVKSEEALIAVPTICDLGDVILGDNYQYITITNNMAENIDVWTENTGTVSLERIEIPAGSSTKARLLIDTAFSGNMEIPIVYKAQTESMMVSAEIQSMVIYRVIEPKIEKEKPSDQKIENENNIELQTGTNLILLEEENEMIGGEKVEF